MADKLVKCRYTKCSKLHANNELLKSEAVQGGTKYYYHPDCYHTMKTILEIRDLFVQKVNPIMTGSQIGQLVATINNIVFTKGVEVDLLKFAVEYFIKYKPGALHCPPGLHYIIQNRDVLSAWKMEQDRKLRNEIRAEIENNVNQSTADCDLPEITQPYKNQNRSKFSRVIGV